MTDIAEEHSTHYSKLSVYLVCDIWSYIARIPSTFDDHIFVLVTV